MCCLVAKSFLVKSKWTMLALARFEVGGGVQTGFCFLMGKNMHGQNSRMGNLDFGIRSRTDQACCSFHQLLSGQSKQRQAQGTRTDLDPLFSRLGTSDSRSPWAVPPHAASSCTLPH